MGRHHSNACIPFGRATEWFPIGCVVTISIEYAPERKGKYADLCGQLDDPRLPHEVQNPCHRCDLRSVRLRSAGGKYHTTVLIGCKHGSFVQGATLDAGAICISKSIGHPTDPAGSSICTVSVALGKCALESSSLTVGRAHLTSPHHETM